MTGIYSAAAGMAAQQTWLDALANDLANVNTPGYRSERVAFRDLVHSGDGAGAGAASSILGVDRDQGALQQRSDPLSFAIEGDGYFQVERPDGEIALTRDGRFHADADGRVVTISGDPLEPPIALPAGVSPGDVVVGTDGTVQTKDGKPLGKIQPVQVPSPDRLQPLGDGQFGVTPESGKPVAATGTVHQFFVEASNVDVADALTQMIRAQRAFELQSRAIATQDQLLEMANQLRR